MQYGRIPGLDKPVSRLVQGTMMLNSEEEEQSHALLDAVYEQGINTFDTGHAYGNGDCERVLGRWMHARGLRDRVVILDKGAHHNVDRQRVTPFDITADLYDSLARLKVDAIDLYLLHRDDPAQPVGPIMETLDEHHRAGRIRVIGASNWTHRRIQEANAYAKTHGLTPLSVSSPNFSLAEQAEPPWVNCVTISGPAHADARAWYLESRMPLFAWSSLAGGFFSGRLRRANFETVKETFPESTIRAYAIEPNFRRLDRVERLAREKGLTVPQVALAYVLNQPLDLYALVGACTPDECRANVQVLDVALTPEEMAWLDLRRDVS